MNLNQTLGALALVALPATALATNGMNLEGYGPVATAMGGASFAYQNGAGAMMNNPATLGLMPEGHAIGAALGYLGPNVSAAGTKSGGDAYFMPAFGYVAKQGRLTYGIGVYSQGGMGTEYGSGSPLAYNTGERVRSEVGVGRLILPLTYNVNDQLTLGGSLDWVWATMDLKMAATGGQFMAMSTGDMSPGFGTMLMHPTSGLMANGADRFRIDFSDSNDFSGEAFGSGFALKLGLVYKIAPSLSVGATYHSKTSLGDMETDNRGASFSAYNSTTGMRLADVKGKVIVHDFQWPETYGIGLAYQATPDWLIVADYKRINWADAMRDFMMTFETGGDFADFTISQNWKDQNVFMLGAAYRLNDQLTLRFGGNFAGNPVPDNRVHPMFPATVKNHYTFGFGYLLNRQSSLDFSMTYAPQVKVRGSQVADVPLSNAPSNNLSISHSQINWQLQYGYFF